MGWVIIGNVCVSGAHTPNPVTTFKICFLDNHLLPCDNVVSVKEDFSQGFKDNSLSVYEDGLSPNAPKKTTWVEQSSRED